MDREPRFYAWVGFQGGYYEVLNKDPNNKAYPESYMPGNNGRVILDFLRNGNQGRKERVNNYSPGGYLNKKATFPDHLVSKNSVSPIETPWTIIRLADLYLLYAEACVELLESVFVPPQPASNVEAIVTAHNNDKTFFPFINSPHFHYFI